MPTLEEMRKIAKEKRFKFDVCFIGEVYGEYRYDLVTSECIYYGINYNDVYEIFINNIKSVTVVD